MRARRRHGEDKRDRLSNGNDLAPFDDISRLLSRPATTANIDSSRPVRANTGHSLTAWRTGKSTRTGFSRFRIRSAPLGRNDVSGSTTARLRSGNASFLCITFRKLKFGGLPRSGLDPSSDIGRV